MRNLFSRFRVTVALAGAFILGATALAIGQAGWSQIVSPTGLEQVGVNSVGSANQNWVQLSTLRNTTGYQISASTSGTVTMSGLADNLLLTAALTGATTVDLPPSPPDGTLASVNNATATAFTGETITVATTDSSTIVGSASLASLAASTGAEFQYTAASAKWYRLR